MAFNTAEFFIFWFVLYLLFLAGGHSNKWKIGILLCANLVFFTWLTQYAVILLLAASAIDFSIARAIQKQVHESQKKWLMRLSVGLNVSLILTFRHINDWLTLNNMESAWHFPIPLAFIGVSFYAFRSMSYVFDVYYENIEEAETQLINYWTYASFFPLMLSGPIAGAENFLAKIKNGTWVIGNKELSLGSFYIASGIIKKFIIGNYLSINFIDRVFESASFFTSMEVFIASILQTFALYFDFSGYTDIAIGLALWLGFQIPQNFHFPFFAQNVTDYWKRWHITLSQWFNSYVYFPLSYSLRSWKRLGTSISVFVVFAISGFWHGTAPNYWLWGIMHALCMVWDVYTANWRSTWRNVIPRWIYAPISVFLTFGFLTYSGVYFKSRRIEDANIMIQKIAESIDWSLWTDWYELYSGVFWMAVLGILGHFLMEPIYTKLEKWASNRSYIFSALFLFIVIVIAYQFNRLGSLPFYYLQF